MHLAHQGDAVFLGPLAGGAVIRQDEIRKLTRDHVLLVGGRRRFLRSTGAAADGTAYRIWPIELGPAWVP